MVTNISGIRPGMPVEEALLSLLSTGEIESSVLKPTSHPVAETLTRYETQADDPGSQIMVLVKKSSGKVVHVTGSPLVTPFGDLGLGDPISRASDVTNTTKATTGRAREFFCGTIQEDGGNLDFEIMCDDGIITNISLMEHIPFRPGATTPKD